MDAKLAGFVWDYAQLACYALAIVFWSRAFWLATREERGRRWNR
jgi:hypothetical protein